MDAAEPAEKRKSERQLVIHTRSFDGTSFISNSAYNYIWGWGKCPSCPLCSTGSKFDANLKTDIKVIFDYIDKPMQCDGL